MIIFFFLNNGRKCGLLALDSDNNFSGTSVGMWCEILLFCEIGLVGTVFSASAFVDGPQ